MSIAKTLEARKSTRAFLDKAVPRAVIEKILKSARHAPSGTNTQPWKVAVVSGEKRRALSDKIVAAFQSGQPPQMDYHYYPQDWTEPYKTRRKECGLQLYQTLSITREDKERQKEQWLANYRAFEAPSVLFFFMDPVLEKGSFVDMGMFLQSVMLMAVEEGLATCPQASLGEYPDIVRAELGYGDEVLICGMALGYEDKEAVINSYRTPRLEVDAFTRFFE
ncbi:MAG: nitroreductase [Pseudomonadota bacterium]|nr:nitroreductase [Pseudomonadota bacterium]QKK05691.1 MAG: nitroreductase [Pseudomonadota bacterium]